MSATRLVTPGKPVASALNRAPFVVVLIAILGGGIAAVLWLNTMTDEAGMRTSTARSSSTDLRLTIEALQRDVANLDCHPADRRRRPPRSAWCRPVTPRCWSSTARARAP